MYTKDESGVSSRRYAGVVALSCVMDVRAFNHNEVNVKNIEIVRYTDHPEGHQGVVEPTDKAWQLVIDKDGLPHFFVAGTYDGGKVAMMDIDTLLPGDLTIASFVGADYSGDVDDETIAECEAELAQKPGLVSPVL